MIATLESFGGRFMEVDASIGATNSELEEGNLYHWVGSVGFPYTLLSPNGYPRPGLTFRGVPSNIVIPSSRGNTFDQPPRQSVSRFLVHGRVE